MTKDYREVAISAQDGLQLFYRDYKHAGADKTPLLCLPGLTRNSADFERFAQRYQGERRIIAVDNRGRGKSAWPKDASSYNPQSYLSDLHHVLTAANCHRVIVIGTSLGGILAMGMGAMLPTALAGVVLNDIGPEIDPVGVARIQGYVGKSAPPQSFEEAAATMAKNYAVAFPDYGPEDWLAEARVIYLEDPNGGLMDDYDPAVSQSIAGGAPTDVDLWAMFASLSHVPVLSIRGALSDILNPKTVARMAEINPALDGITVANRGHAPTYDEPECLACLPDFFRKCDAQSSAGTGPGASAHD